MERGLRSAEGRPYDTAACETSSPTPTPRRSRPAWGRNLRPLFQRRTPTLSSPRNPRGLATKRGGPNAGSPGRGVRGRGGGPGGPRTTDVGTSRSRTATTGRTTRAAGHSSPGRPTQSTDPLGLRGALSAHTPTVGDCQGWREAYLGCGGGPGDAGVGPGAGETGP